MILIIIKSSLLNKYNFVIHAIFNKLHVSFDYSIGFHNFPRLQWLRPRTAAKCIYPKCSKFSS